MRWPFFVRLTIKNVFEQEKSRSHPEALDESVKFLIWKREVFRKVKEIKGLRGDVHGTSHKQHRRLTQRLRKRAVSRQKLDEATLLCVERQINAVVNTKLTVNIVDMNFDRSFADDQLLGDLVVT